MPCKRCLHAIGQTIFQSLSSASIKTTGEQSINLNMLGTVMVSQIIASLVMFANQGQGHTNTSQKAMLGLLVINIWMVWLQECKNWPFYTIWKSQGFRIIVFIIKFGAIFTVCTSATHFVTLKTTIRIYWRHAVQN